MGVGVLREVEVAVLNFHNAVSFYIVLHAVMTLNRKTIFIAYFLTVILLLL